MTWKMRLLVPLMPLVLATCWAGVPNTDPILDDVDPQVIQEVADNYRLPTDVVPTAYWITLQTWLDVSDSAKNFTFLGKSVIALNVRRTTSSITFHADNLNITNYKVEYLPPDDKKKIKVQEVMTNPHKNFVTFLLDVPLKQGETVELSLDYTGVINDKLRGFYRSSYLDGNNKRWLAATQFEPTYARKAFPCWDEPGLKAVFDISIQHNRKYTALSNMAVKEINDIDQDWKTTTFKRTPKMPTYLVAFVVSDFKGYPEDDKTFKVWTKPPAIGSAKHAYEYGKRILKELGDWTGIQYRMEKMDQIALPDFMAGAMENWGLVTYREPYLLYTEGKSGIKNKQDVTTVIAHEFAHQWFGNLVTCEWWDYIWLNEGFASFFQYYITDKVLEKDQNEKEWRLMEQFIVNNVQVSSFVVDASTKSRPMNAKPSVQTPAQISSLFDNISYKKAGSVINMMRNFLSDKTFQEGIKQYLTDHNPDISTSVVTPNDLFNSITKALKSADAKKSLPPGVSLNQVMENWVNEAGYPVVTVEKNNNSEIVLQQKRFFLVKPVKKDNTQWYIPISYIEQDGNNTLNMEWMAPGSSKKLTKAVANKWILINKDQAGYYRVNYNEENWNLLAKYLTDKFKENKQISAVSRAQLIDDALNLARAGDLNYKNAMDITLYLHQEKDYIPWHAAVRAFEYLDNILQGTKNYKIFRRYVAHKVQAFTDDVRFDNVMVNDTHVNKLAKVLALNTACKYGVEKCEKFVQDQFTKWLEAKKEDKENKIWIDYRKDVICAALRKANEQTLDKTLEKHKNTQDAEEKTEILAGLGCVTDEKIVNKFLESTLNNTVISIFDALNSVYHGNPASFKVLMKFIVGNIEKIRGKNNENVTLLVGYLNKLAHRVTTTEQFLELSLLVHGHLPSDQTFEGFSHAMDNIVWHKNHQQIVSKWLADNDPDKKQKPNSAVSFGLNSCLVIVGSLLFTQL